jgi:hypothetical protein
MARRKRMARKGKPRPVPNKKRASKGGRGSRSGAGGRASSRKGVKNKR